MPPKFILQFAVNMEHLSINRHSEGTQCFDHEFSKDASTQTEWIVPIVRCIVPTKYLNVHLKRQREGVLDHMRKVGKIPKIDE